MCLSFWSKANTLLRCGLESDSRDSGTKSGCCTAAVWTRLRSHLQSRMYVKDPKPLFWKTDEPIPCALANVYPSISFRFIYSFRECVQYWQGLRLSFMPKCSLNKNLFFNISGLLSINHLGKDGKCIFLEDYNEPESFLHSSVIQYGLAIYMDKAVYSRVSCLNLYFPLLCGAFKWACTLLSYGHTW